ncbi:hypothetical protein [Pyxidicoccus xibeiensis]|uniref:hypothetical protein n=1 Tax=Pyxidicoccus xibeiensis TaxID=2906759 RepID=UPI0020A812CE|nr:hypothetical protein [Pyxidicoccus xibeiensis]MCP3139585.1 hypothetical protein [Pyxidicoccus xibeiensis]
MKTYVVKAGGSGNLVETEAVHKIEWLAYRRLRFDPSYLEGLIEGLRGVASSAKVAFVPGGMGAFLFLDLAESAGVRGEALDRIGIDVVNLNGLLARSAFAENGISVFPELVEPGEMLAAALEVSQVVVVKACKGYLSTDALAAAAAVSLPGSELLIFKKGVPVYHVGFERPTEVLEWKITELKERAKAFGERPGANSILDAQCLEIVEQGQVEVSLVDSSALRCLAEVFARKSSVPHSRVILG